MPYADPQRQREFRREQMRRLRAADPEKYRRSRRESARRRRAVDPLRGMTEDEFRAASRKYAATRRARKLAQFVEAVDPRVVYEMWGGMCGVCKGFIVGDFHVDHIVPLAAGGVHGYVNVQPAHPSCNLRKGSRAD